MNQLTAQQSVTSDERMWAAICHASGLVGYLGAPAGFHILIPLIIWLVARTDKPFVDDQGKEAVNFQISLTLYTVLAAILAIPMAIILTITVVGIPLIGVLIAVGVAFFILGAVLAGVAAYHAGNGQYFRYPLTVRFIK